MTVAPQPAELDLPRAQAGAQPQHLLLTLLGDYWFQRDEHLPSAALVDLLAEFGVSAGGARAALSRPARPGLPRSAQARRAGPRRAAAFLQVGPADILRAHPAGGRRAHRWAAPDRVVRRRGTGLGRA